MADVRVLCRPCQVVRRIVEWVRKKAEEDILRAKRRQEKALGLELSRPQLQLADAEDSDEDNEDGDNETVPWHSGGFADMASTLFAHQRAAVRWMIRVERSASLRGGILADEMGLGKTVSILALICGNTPCSSQASNGGAATAAVAASSARMRKPTLVVLPLSLLQQWKREVETHTRPGSVSMHVYYGEGRRATAEELALYEVVLTTYDVLVNDHAAEDEEEQTYNDEEAYDDSKSFDGALHEVRWHRLVCDEAAFVKNLGTGANLGTWT